MLAQHNESTKTLFTNEDAGELLEIQSLMRAAFEREQWQDLADLDKRCRRFVTALSKTPDQSLIVLLTDTLSFYRQLLQEFNVEKSSIASEVMTLRRAQSNNHVYRMMDALH